jgi:hypothetical protein
MQIDQVVTLSRYLAFGDRAGFGDRASLFQHLVQGLDPAVIVENEEITPRRT